MIVGVDHLAVSAVDVEVARAALTSAGFEVLFTEVALHNADEKAALLRMGSATHDIVYARGPLGIAVEATCHGALPTQVGRYTPLLSGPVTGTTLKDSAEAPVAWAFAAAFPEADVTRAWWEAFGTDVYFDATGSTPGISAVGLGVASVADAVAFWVQCLRFRVVDLGTAGGVEWSRLRLAAPVPSWSVDVVLYDAPEAPGFVDDRGFGCLALLSTRISTDCAAIGATPFQFEVGGRSLRVAMGRGRSLEPVEIIEVGR